MDTVGIDLSGLLDTLARDRANNPPCQTHSVTRRPTGMEIDDLVEAAAALCAPPKQYSSARSIRRRRTTTPAAETPFAPLTEGTFIAFMLGDPRDPLSYTCQLGIVDAVAEEMAMIGGRRIHRSRIKDVAIQRQPSTLGS